MYQGWKYLYIADLMYHSIIIIENILHTSRIIREAPGNGADLPGSRKG